MKNLTSLVKNRIKRNSTSNTVTFLKKLKKHYESFALVNYTIYGKLIKNRLNMKRYSKKSVRYLEIGPGKQKLPGFETINITGGSNVDFVFDASKSLPFHDNTFNLVYASHILEHIPWYETEEVLKEWVRILKTGGKLEIWVPDGLKICDVLIKAENGTIKENPDNWNVLNSNKNPFVWVNGRLLYGANPGYPSWHKAIFTPKYLKQFFNQAGLKNIETMQNSEVRGYDHGWINLGVKGEKP